MAEAATRPYNLRSSEEVVAVPVQLYLSDDNRFMPDLLASDRTYTGQVNDSESSINDSDCEALVNSPLSKACSSSAYTVVHKNLDLTVGFDCIGQ